MKAFINWSGGKDSALCLYKAKQEGLKVEALVTTLSIGRVTMHGVKKELIERQAEAIGLPVHFIELDSPGMESYEAAIHQMNFELKEKGFTHVISGDLFLEDLKQYRTRLYEQDGLTCLFPLWGQQTINLVHEFIEKGFKAVVVAVNGELLDKKYCGRMLDWPFINSLPSTVNNCGENGEYHSFVVGGPIFSKPIDFTLDEVVTKRYPRPKNEKECFREPTEDMEFHFIELLP
jgi:uncharacterized protein (TIGR00290 family)